MASAVTGYGWLTVPYQVYNDAFNVDFMCGHKDGIDSFAINATADDQTTEVDITAPTDRSYVQIGTNYDGSAIYANVYRFTVSSANLASLADGLNTLKLTITHTAGATTPTGTGTTTFPDEFTFYNDAGTPNAYIPPVTNQVAGATVHVKPTNGDDGNTGLSAGAAVKTLKKAIEILAGINTTPNVTTYDVGGGTISIAEAGTLSWPDETTMGVNVKGTQTWLEVTAASGLTAADVKIDRVMGGGCPSIQFLKFTRIQLDEVKFTNSKLWLNRCNVTRNDYDAPVNAFGNWQANDRQYATGTEFDTGLDGPQMPDLMVGGAVRNVQADALDPWRRPDGRTVACVKISNIIDVVGGNHHPDVFQVGPYNANNIMIFGVFCEQARGRFIGSGYPRPLENWWIENCTMSQAWNGTHRTHTSRFSTAGFRHFVMRNCTMANQRLTFNITPQTPFGDFEISSCLLDGLTPVDANGNLALGFIAKLEAETLVTNNVVGPSSWWKPKTNTIVANFVFPRLSTTSPQVWDFRLSQASPGWGHGLNYSDYTHASGEAAIYNTTPTKPLPNCGAYWSGATGDYTQHVLYQP